MGSSRFRRIGSVKWRGWVVLGLLTLGSGVSAKQASRLEPHLRFPLKSSGYHSSIAFPNENEVLIGWSEGVTSIALKDGSAKIVIPSGTAPDGISRVRRVRSDGKSVAAFNQLEEYILRLEDGKRLLSRRVGDFVVIDLVLSGDTIFMLGNPAAADFSKLENPGGVALWCLAPPTDWRMSWRKLKPIHRLSYGEEAKGTFLVSRSPYGGALALEPDGSIWVITASEPGLYHYTKEGRLLDVLAHELDDLVIRRMHEAERVYKTDLDRRYGEVLNRQPILDDLVMTPDGPALVVRRGDGNGLRWSLLYPSRTKVRAEFPLALDGRGPFRHLACAAHGARLACLVGTALHPEAKASEGMKAFEETFEVVLFDLPKVNPVTPPAPPAKL